MFILHFETGNAAFEDSLDQEIARILAKVAGAVAAGGVMGKVRDSNSNSIGEWRLDHETN